MLPWRATAGGVSGTRVGVRVYTVIECDRLIDCDRALMKEAQRLQPFRILRRQLPHFAAILGPPAFSQICNESIDVCAH